jgi:hypothetical protein
MANLRAGLILGERLGPLQILGGVTVVTAVGLATVSIKGLTARTNFREGGSDDLRFGLLADSGSRGSA